MFLKPHQKDALVMGDERYSYEQLIRCANGISSLIQAEKGDRIAIFAESSPQWIMSIYAIWRRDGIAVPLDFMSSADELAYMVNDCRPKTIFFSEGTEATLDEAWDTLAEKPQRLSLNELKKIDFSEESLEYNIPDLMETAEIIYTSGTTGNPKGVMLSFDNILLNVEHVHDEGIYSSEDRFIQILPIHHSYALHGNVVAPLYWGSTLYMIAKLDPQTILDTLQQNKITHMLAVPRLLQLFHKKIFQTINASAVTRTVFNTAGKLKKRQTRRKIFKKVHKVFGGELKYIVSGGAKLEDDIWRDFDALGFEILNGYGMTEMAPMISNTSPGKTKFGTTGTMIKSVEAKSVDGELVVRGRNLMQGYYKLPKETAETIRDGWLYTGDLGHVDDEGYICITGRRKELIILSNGKNISPEEIEHKVLDQSPFIKDIGVYENNDRLQAVVLPDFDQLQQDGIPDADSAIREYILNSYNPAVSPYKKIMHYDIVKEELPRTRLGKLKRFELPGLAQAAAGRQDKASVSAEDLPRDVWELLKGYIETEKSCSVNPADDIEIDLGMDSLDRVELQVFLNASFGVEVDEELFAANRTAGALTRYLAEHRTRTGVKSVRWSEVLREKIDFKLPKSGPLHLFLRGLSRLYFKTFFKFRVTGLEHLPEGPFILAPNHQSAVDGLLTASMLPRNVLKRTYTFAKEKHFRHQWRRFMAKRNNIIIVDMNRELKQSIQKVAHVLKEKGNLIIFPEGTRSRDGELLPFKKTFAILSRELQVPVIPVTIEGTADAFPVGRIRPRLYSKIRINVLPPVFPEKLSYHELTDRVKDIISTRLKKK